MKVKETPYHTSGTVKYVIGEGDITISDIERLICAERVEYTLSSAAKQRILECREYLDNKVQTAGRPLYGITTGFGSLCNISIPSDDLTTLQENLVKSHSCSYGEEVPMPVVKIMLLLKAHALSLGKSGVQIETVQCIVDMLNHDVIPVVYDKGSLGASGDLAPLAKLFLPIIGEGDVYYKGKIVDAKAAFDAEGIPTVTLKSKEGLALLNGTQFMSSHAVYALILGRRALYAATAIGALSLEAFDGLDAPFIPQLHEIRPHPGQIEVATQMRSMLEGSVLQTKAKPQVQDPYSFRCIPQVHGASWDTYKYVESIITREINSVTDNPTVFPEDDLIVSGGNFHGQPIALVMDFFAIAMAELGNISERRTAQLILGLRDLPEFLVAQPGLNSGFMIPQYAAAAMVSRNKMYCFAASSDSIVSSNGQEDHVSMGANAATKLLPLLDNLYAILGIELLNAAQAMELKESQTETSPRIKKLFDDFRKKCTFVKDDVVMYPVLDHAATFVYGYDFANLHR
ncbi:MAG: histidine ammonia-lyase [Porphyromonas sp.]|nr:histidine ammonia-lyase [Porphyromonas sp.]